MSTHRINAQLKRLYPKCRALFLAKPFPIHRIPTPNVLNAEKKAYKIPIVGRGLLHSSRKPNGIKRRVGRPKRSYDIPTGGQGRRYSPLKRTGIKRKVGRPRLVDRAYTLGNWLANKQWTMKCSGSQGVALPIPSFIKGVVVYVPYSARYFPESLTSILMVKLFQIDCRKIEWRKGNSRCLVSILESIIYIYINTI